MTFRLNIVLPVALATLMLSACTTTSGVKALGADTRTVTVTSSNAANAKRMAHEDAEHYCRQRNQQVLVVRMTRHTNEFARTLYTLDFKCLNPGDKQLQNPEYDSLNSNVQVQPLL